MMTIKIFSAGLFFSLGTFGQGQERPPQFSEIIKRGFKKHQFSKLSDDEKTRFYKVYPPDREILNKATLGLIEKTPVYECIAGEAPAIDTAYKKFPIHYPRCGRMKQVRGVFEWSRPGGVIFKTKTQCYQIKEFHILHRLKELGFSKGSKARKGIVEAIWMMNRFEEEGLQIIYMQRVTLEKD